MICRKLCICLDLGSFTKNRNFSRLVTTLCNTTVAKDEYLLDLYQVSGRHLMYFLLKSFASQLYCIGHTSKAWYRIRSCLVDLWSICNAMLTSGIRQLNRRSVLCYLQPVELDRLQETEKNLSHRRNNQRHTRPLYMLVKNGTRCKALSFFSITIHHVVITYSSFACCHPIRFFRLPRWGRLDPHRCCLRHTIH